MIYITDERHRARCQVCLNRDIRADVDHLFSLGRFSIDRLVVVFEISQSALQRHRAALVAAVERCEPWEAFCRRYAAASDDEDAAREKRIRAARRR